MSSPVGWDVDPLVAAWPGLPALSGNVTADVCVVGLGGSGLAAVDAAVSRGLSVVGVDAGRVAAGAAGRNGGFLLGGPAPFLHDAVAAWGPPAVELYRVTLAEIDALVELLPAGAVRRAGSIRLAGLPGEPVDAAEAAEREREAADCRAHAVALRAAGIAVESYDGVFGRGIFLPDDAATNPAVRAVALASRLAPVAGLFERTTVTRVESGRVHTAGGIVSCGAVAVAVDGGLPALLPTLAGRVRTARLQMLATAPLPAPVVPCPVYGRWGYDYVQQASDGRLFAGGGRDRFVDAEWTDATDPTPGVQAHIEQVAARFVPRPLQVTHRWAASVGFTADGRPLCTQVAPGVVAAGGYNGTGNLVGPVAARAALAYALDGTPPPPYLAS